MVGTLRQIFGTSSVWGDLDARSARELYRRLLPRVLVHDDSRNDPVPLRRLRSRAATAARARRAAKSYVRERSILPIRLLALALDSARSGSSAGASVDELLAKYRGEARRALGSGSQRDRIDRLAYALLLRKSCETNRVIDCILDLDDELVADWPDDRRAAWSAFLLEVCADDDHNPHTRSWGPYVRARWLARRIDRSIKRRQPNSSIADS